MLLRLRAECRDILELLLIPGLAAVLPWRMCFILFKRIACWRYPYRETCERALAQAKRRGWVGDEAQWLAQRRLITMVDHSDHYLARTRSDAWMRRHLDVQGNWPAADQRGIFCTFHWGAGMWGLRHAASSGLKPHALVAALDGAHFAGRSVMHWYAKSRTASVAQALRRPVLDVSSSLKPALLALKRDEQVLAAVDVPADQVAASECITILGMKARVPRALLRIAVDHAAPVTLYITGIRLTDGHRFLRIMPLGVYSDVSALMRDTFKELERLIQEEPVAWHFWSEAERFFEAEEA